MTIGTNTLVVELNEGGLAVKTRGLCALVESDIVDVAGNATALGVDDDGVDCTGHVADIVVESVAGYADTNSLVVADLVEPTGIDGGALTVGGGLSAGTQVTGVAYDLALVGDTGLTRQTVSCTSGANTGESVERGS